MPYKFDTLKIKMPKKFDRRIKLTDEDREKIKLLHKNGYAIRAIARMFETKCCRRTIQFVLFPARAERVNKMTNAKWRERYDKVKHAKRMKEYRQYKQKVLKSVDKKADE